MATIAQNLQQLITDRTDIANAITAKGGTLAEGAGFDDFAAAISGIPTSNLEIGNYTSFINNHVTNNQFQSTANKISASITINAFRYNFYYAYSPGNFILIKAPITFTKAGTDSSSPTETNISVPYVVNSNGAYRVITTRGNVILSNNTTDFFGINNSTLTLTIKPLCTSTESSSSYVFAVLFWSS